MANPLEGMKFCKHNRLSNACHQCKIAKLEERIESLQGHSVSVKSLAEIQAQAIRDMVMNIKKDRRLGFCHDNTMLIPEPLILEYADNLREKE